MIDQYQGLAVMHTDRCVSVTFPAGLVDQPGCRQFDAFSDRVGHHVRKTANNVFKLRLLTPGFLEKLPGLGSTAGSGSFRRRTASTASAAARGVSASFASLPRYSCKSR